MNKIQYNTCFTCSNTCIIIWYFNHYKTSTPLVLRILGQLAAQLAQRRLHALRRAQRGLLPSGALRLPGCAGGRGGGGRDEGVREGGTFCTAPRATCRQEHNDRVQNDRHQLRKGATVGEPAPAHPRARARPGGLGGAVSAVSQRRTRAMRSAFERVASDLGRRKHKGGP